GAGRSPRTLRGCPGGGQWSGSLGRDPAPPLRAVRHREAERRRHRARALTQHRARARRRPRPRDHHARRCLLPHAAPGAEMSATVLVVDDEAVFRVLVEEALVSEGFEVRTAGTLRKARTEIDTAAPDVLIIDRRLPDGDGIDFLKALHADGPPATVVVVVT